jgi:hypothetical protein
MHAAVCHRVADTIAGQVKIYPLGAEANTDIWRVRWLSRSLNLKNMARRSTLDCDRCSIKDEPGSHCFSVRIKNYIDAAGARDTEVLQFDLCPDCQSLLLTKMLAEACDYDEKWIKYLKAIVTHARELK